MDKTIFVVDELNCAKEKGIKKSFEPDGIYTTDFCFEMYLFSIEKILLSCMVQKFNKKAKRQDRGLLITSKAIYNLSKACNYSTRTISSYNHISDQAQDISYESLWYNPQQNFIRVRCAYS